VKFEVAERQPVHHLAARNARRGKADPVLVGSTTTHTQARGSSRGVRPKLASQTADRILADVIARGWPVGEVLGSELELLERYGVSRAVFREAVRIVEHQQVARMRRGPGGGLVVDAPSVNAVIDAVVVYMFYADARLDEVFEARTVLEESAAELAAERLTDRDVMALRELVDDEAALRVSDERRLHSLLASSTANPALELFVEILNRVTRLYLSDRSLITPALGESADAHAWITKAVLAGDGGLARRRMRRHLEGEAEFIRGHRTSRQALGPEDLAGTPDGVKRAERISRSIFRDVVERGWPVGEALGSETELMERFQASRAVFREAVRLLEHHQIATMRRGRGGGLFVVAPGVASIADATAIYLEQRGIDASHLTETRAIVELSIVELAAERIDDQKAQHLLASLDKESAAEGDDFSTAAHDFHVVLAEVTGNRVLELMARVLARLTKLHQVPEASVADGVAEMHDAVMRAHRAIVDAVVAGDAQLAGHRMRRHLDAQTPWLR
jgi:DNA-binding FadR family transcriptional regulator